MELKFKLWVENEDGERIIGEGLYKLLLSIRETGSISRAAKELDMSYRAAWGKLNKSENRLGYQLVEKRLGGRDGGGTILTENGKELLDKFAQLNQQANQMLKEAFQEYFYR